MSLIEKDLGCDVLGCATNRVGALGHDLRETIVNQLEEAIVTDHDIFRLQVTIYDIAAMQVLENAGNLGAVESKI